MAVSRRVGRRGASMAVAEGHGGVAVAGGCVAELALEWISCA
jgi:hypothetical protein